MDKQMNQQDVYRQEAYELLDEFESALLELEEIPDNEDLIGRVFRAMHTIKGSGAMYGFDAIAAFTHEIETVFDLVREGRMTVTKNLINLSLSCRDLILEMLGADDTDPCSDPEKATAIIDALKALIPSAESAGKDRLDDSDPATDSNPQVDENRQMATYRVRFKPAMEIFLSGTNPLLLLEELAQLGECHIIAHTKDIPHLTGIDTEACYVFWDIILTTDKGLDSIEDVFIFVADTCELSIQVIDAGNEDEAASEYKKLGEILVERGDLNPETVNRMLEEQKLIGEMLTQAASVADGNLRAIAEEVERLVCDLRDNTMSIRMRPIGTTFSKFKRLVRDLSESLGRQVVLTTEGGETELDKTVLEQLGDPLVHIIRNCIDHGIETPDARIQADKPAHGTVHLSAEHVGANVVIQITDDGAGLDAESIRESAIAKGVLLPEAELSEKETFELIFAPGFSTAKTVTDVSGRGVGMDVVKKNIETLRGSIDVSSKKGVGTTISLTG